VDRLAARLGRCIEAGLEAPWCLQRTQAEQSREKILLVSSVSAEREVFGRTARTLIQAVADANIAVEEFGADRGSILSSEVLSIAVASRSEITMFVRFVLIMPI
jgi:hypothetical protein